MIQKPSYSTTKKNLYAAWIVIFALAIGAIVTNQVMAFANLAFPYMVGLIAVMLGVHRGFGSFDMRTIAKHALPSEPPFNPRDDPAGGER